jgi:hypothetical protein
VHTSPGTRPSAVSSVVRPSPLQGMHGTPALCASKMDAILSPSRCITREGGPMNDTPCS